jgi:hypothetical protein
MLLRPIKVHSSVKQIADRKRRSLLVFINGEFPKPDKNILRHFQTEVYYSRS